MGVPHKLKNQSDKFHKNITKRGKVDTQQKEASSLGVGPIVVGFLLFVVVGSAILQVVRTSIS